LCLDRDIRGRMVEKLVKNEKSVAEQAGRVGGSNPLWGDFFILMGGGSGGYGKWI
jgi:hypothetical protein